MTAPGPGRARTGYRLPSVTQWVLALLPCVLVPVAIYYRDQHSTARIVRRLFAENHAVQLVTFAALTLGGILGWVLALQWRRRSAPRLLSGFYAVFGTGLLFVAMEEVSWGQWIFGFDTPDGLRELNKQGELNFHNLPAFHAPFEYLRLAFGLGGLVSLGLAFHPRMRPVGAPLALATWFLWISVLAGLDLHNLYAPPTRGSLYRIGARQAELLEMLIGCSALLYMWFNRRLVPDLRPRDPEVS